LAAPEKKNVLGETKPKGVKKGPTLEIMLLSKEFKVLKTILILFFFGYVTQYISLHLHKGEKCKNLKNEFLLIIHFYRIKRYML